MQKLYGDARIPFIDHSISINPRKHLNNSKSHPNAKGLVSYGIVIDKGSPTKRSASSDFFNDNNNDCDTDRNFG